METTRIKLGWGYRLVINDVHSAPKTVIFTGKVPDSVVTNIIARGESGVAGINWIGPPTVSSKTLFENGVTNPIVTTIGDFNELDRLKLQKGMGINPIKEWYFYGGSWTNFAGGIYTQRPCFAEILMIHEAHDTSGTNWVIPVTHSFK